LESFGGGAKGGPPSGASFFEEKEFRAALGTDEASGDDLGVVENEKVFWREDGGEVADVKIGYFPG
jgi:hypothetical protein